MKATVRQLLGLAFGIVSFVGTIIICALPKWRVSKWDGVPASSEGLWKFCDIKKDQTVCRGYDEHAPVSEELKNAGALIVIAIIVEIIGILLGIAGSKFINFVPEMKKSKMAMASGVVFLIAGFFVLISVCLTTKTIDVQSPRSEKSEPGASVFIGWIITGLLILGGGLLCSSFPRWDGTD